MDAAPDAGAGPRGGRDGDRWQTWRRATETVLSRVAAEVTASTGLSEADYAVLDRLDELGGGSLRQSELAGALGWARPRTSTHLTRMQEAGLVTRSSTASAVVVALTSQGRWEIGRARPVHAAAVRRHLLDPLDTGQLAVLDVALTRWGTAG